MVTSADLRRKKCHPRKEALDKALVQAHLAAVPDWVYENGWIARTFAFTNYYQTMAFVNAVAWLAHREDHHPDLHVTYRHCTVRLQTHSVNGGAGGISENDFICAALIDALQTSGTEAA